MAESPHADTGGYGGSPPGREQHGRSDLAQHPVRRLRPARRRGEGRRGSRRLASRRRDGQPFRPEPYPRPAGRAGAAQACHAAHRLPPDDRGPRPVCPRLRGGGRWQRDHPRGSREGPGADAAGHPGRRGALRPRRQPRHRHPALRRPARRGRHGAADDGGARLRRPEVPRHRAAEDPPYPRHAHRPERPSTVGRPRDLDPGRRRRVGRDDRAVRRGRRGRVRRRVGRLRCPGPGARRARPARAGRAGDGARLLAPRVTPRACPAASRAPVPPSPVARLAPPSAGCQARRARTR